MDQNEFTPSDGLSPAGQGVQKGIFVGTGFLGILVKAGLIGAGVSNPVLLGVTLASSILPSIFGKKKPKAAGLLSEAVQPQGAPVAHIGAFLIQLAAILTAISTYFDGPLVDQLPATWRKWVMFAAAFVAIIIPPLQRIGALLSDVK